MPTRNASRLMTHQVNDGLARAAIEPTLTRTLAHTPAATAVTIANKPANPMTATWTGTASTVFSRSPSQRTSAPAPRMIAEKSAVISSRRRNGCQLSGSGFCAGRVSGTSMVIAIVIARTAMAASKAVHRLSPAINRAMVNETRISGSGTSKMALTPEKRPCWLSGTRSGISACWAACAALAATANTERDAEKDPEAGHACQSGREPDRRDADQRAYRAAEDEGAAPAQAERAAVGEHAPQRLHQQRYHQRPQADGSVVRGFLRLSHELLDQQRENQPVRLREDRQAQEEDVEGDVVVPADGARHGASLSPNTRLMNRSVI